MNIEKLIRNKDLINKMQDSSNRVKSKINKIKSVNYSYIANFTAAFIISSFLTSWEGSIATMLLMIPSILVTSLFSNFINNFNLKKNKKEKTKYYNILNSKYFELYCYASTDIMELMDELKDYNKEDIVEILEYTDKAFVEQQGYKLRVDFYEHLILSKVENLSELDLVDNRELLEKEIMLFKDQKRINDTLSLIIKRIGVKQKMKLKINKKVINI